MRYGRLGVTKLLLGRKVNKPWTRSNWLKVSNVVAGGVALNWQSGTSIDSARDRIGVSMSHAIDGRRGGNRFVWSAGTYFGSSEQASVQIGHAPDFTPRLHVLELHGPTSADKHMHLTFPSSSVKFT